MELTGVDWVWLVSYVSHVLSGALWTGSVCYVAAFVVPTARRGGLSRAAFERTVDGVLQITRLTGVVLPITGGYQLWRLYGVETLLSTPRGWLVLVMGIAWGLTNGLVELGVLAVSREIGEVSLATYFLERFEMGSDGPGAAASAETLRPYALAAAVCSVVLLVDAGLLAAGVV